MAFTPLNLSEIAAGEPNKQELWTKLLNNQADFDSRIGAVENIQQLPMFFRATGPLDFGTLDTLIDIHRINFDITILAGRLLSITAGSAGSNEVDMLFKRGAGAWTSIFTTKPVTAFGEGDLALNTGTLSVTSLLAGDLLRMDITAAQTDGQSLVGILEFEGA